MSLFPKRTISGGNVTIHWNLNTSALYSKHIVPQVRIVIKNPIGEEYVLFDKHILCLPNIKETSASTNNSSTEGHKYLRKELPLMILADYLAMGEIKRSS